MAEISIKDGVGGVWKLKVLHFICRLLEKIPSFGKPRTGLCLNITIKAKLINIEKIA